MSEPTLDEIVPVRYGWVAAVEAQLTSNGNLLGEVLRRLNFIEGELPECDCGNGTSPTWIGGHMSTCPYHAERVTRREAAFAQRAEKAEDALGVARYALQSILDQPSPLRNPDGVDDYVPAVRLACRDALQATGGCHSS